MSRRTLKKFGRDLALALGTAVVVFVGDNIGTLNLSPEGAAVAVAVVSLGYRTLRGVLGAEPLD